MMLRTSFFFLLRITAGGALEESLRYAVVFDAGSSGTRVSTFRWRLPDWGFEPGDDDPEWYARLAVESLEQLGYEKTKPGISDLAKIAAKPKPPQAKSARGEAGGEGVERAEKGEKGGGLGAAVGRVLSGLGKKKRGARQLKASELGEDDELGAAVAAYLTPLVAHAESFVPAGVARARCPVLFYATAGMRLVTPHQGARVMSAVAYALQRSSFGLAGEGNWTRVISGRQEAHFDWLTVNAALGLDLWPHLSAPETQAPATATASAEQQPQQPPLKAERARSVGALDMGGWSTQIAFLADADLGGRQQGQQSFATSLGSNWSSEAAGGAGAGVGNRASLVGASHLGFGALGAFEALLDLCTKGAVGKPSGASSSRVDCPCLHVGQARNHTLRQTPPTPTPPLGSVESEAGARDGVEAGVEVRADGSVAASASSSSNQAQEQEPAWLGWPSGWAGDLAVLREWEWDDWVGASDFDASGTVDPGELLHILERRERSRPRPPGVDSMSDWSLVGSDAKGLAEALMAVADLDRSGDLDFVEFQAQKRKLPLAGLPNSPSPKAPAAASAAPEPPRSKVEQPPRALDRVVEVAGSGDLGACRAVVRELVQGSILGSPEALRTWQRRPADPASTSKAGTKAHGAPDGTALPLALPGLVGGPWFALDFLATMGQLMLAETLGDARRSGYQVPTVFPNGSVAAGPWSSSPPRGSSSSRTAEAHEDDFAGGEGADAGTAHEEEEEEERPREPYVEPGKSFSGASGADLVYRQKDLDQSRQLAPPPPPPPPPAWGPHSPQAVWLGPRHGPLGLVTVGCAAMREEAARRREGTGIKVGHAQSHSRTHPTFP